MLGALNAVRSVAIWSLIAILTVALCTVGVVPVLLFWYADPRRALGHMTGIAWGRIIRLLHPAWLIRRTGFERVRGQGPFVIVANHQSQIDIAAMYQLPCNMKWISKASNFKVPFMGWFMYLAGYIPLVRGDKESIVRCMERADELLKMGVSVVFFPEGTRSSDGELLPFKLGAFKLAIANQVPILPVTLTGMHKVLPKGEWRIPMKKELTHVWVDEPIPSAGLEDDDAQRLADRARAVIAARKRMIETGVPFPAALEPAMAVFPAAARERVDPTVTAGPAACTPMTQDGKTRSRAAS